MGSMRGRYNINVVILLYGNMHKPRRPMDIHENRDHDDDHFENKAVRLSLNVDRFAIDWSNPIEAYILVYIYTT